VLHPATFPALNPQLHINPVTNMNMWWWAESESGWR